MITGQAGIDLIKSFESLELETYLDPVGIPTIGYGHTQGVEFGQVITEDEANAFLIQDVRNAENSVNQYLPNKLTQNQFDALVSLVFNVGSHNIFTKEYNNGYESGSSLYNLLLQDKFDAAANRFKDFNKAGGQVLNGLVRRREAERQLFEKKTLVCPQCQHSFSYS